MSQCPRISEITTPIGHIVAIFIMATTALTTKTCIQPTYEVDIAPQGVDPGFQSIAQQTRAHSESRARNWRIYLISFVDSLAGLLYGLDTGSIGPITRMPQFQDTVGVLSDLTQGIYVISILLWVALSSFGNGYLADRFSRKYTIFAGAILATVGASISSSVSNIVALFVARAVYGVGIGLGLRTSIVYLVEITPAHQRGPLDCMAQLLIIIGVAAGYFTAYASVSLSGTIAWRIPFIVQACVGVILAVGMLFVPFSPRWFMQKGREEEALETLRRLRNASAENINQMTIVHRELAEIRNDIQFDVRTRQSTSDIEIFHRVTPR
jgi:MFS family permease